MLSVGNVVRHVTESSTFDNVTQFLIEGFIIFKPGENLNIFYEGNISLFIKKFPKSYIIMNKVSETVQLVEVDMTAAITKVPVTEPNIEVPVTESIDKMLNLTMGIFQSLMILLVPIIFLIIVLKMSLKYFIR